MKTFIVYFENGFEDIVRNAESIADVEDKLLSIGFSSRDVATAVIEEIEVDYV